MSKVKQSILPSSPKDQVKLKQRVQSIADAEARIKLERGFIQDTKKSIREDFTLTNKLVSQLITSQVKMNAHEIRAEGDEFDLFHAALFETKHQVSSDPDAQ